MKSWFLYFLACTAFLVWMSGNLPKVQEWLKRQWDNFLYWLKKR